MLHRVKAWFNMQVRARDGDVGEIKDVYFDDHTWDIRYLLVATGAWLDERHVLFVPGAVENAQADGNVVFVDLSREQVADSPPMDEETPVSRQFEIDLHEHYNWPFYWSNFPSAGFGPATIYPPVAPGALAEEGAGERPEATEEEGNPHLRSAREVTGYHVSARDGDVGSVSDFVFDGERWAIFYLIVDTGNWFTPGRKVLLSPTWVEAIDWPNRHVEVDLSRETIKNSPPFDWEKLIDRSYERRLHAYYDLPGYWEEEDENGGSGR